MTGGSPRALSGVCALTAVAAAGVWEGSGLAWYRLPATLPGAAVTVEGEQVSPLWSAGALFALAGIAALVATGGAVRRVLGALLALAGVLVGWRALAALTGLGAEPGPPASALPPGVSAAAAQVTAAPLLAVAGGLVLLGVGLFVVLSEPRMARFGARYAAHGGRRQEADPDRAAWQDLDAGRDPTVHPPRPDPPRPDPPRPDPPRPDPAAGTGSGRRRRADAGPPGPGDPRPVRQGWGNRANRGRPNGRGSARPAGGNPAIGEPTAGRDGRDDPGGGRSTGAV